MRVSQFAKYTLGLGALLISLAFRTPLFAQATSTVRGQITDPSGAAVTQATVVATPAPGPASQTQPGQTRAATVNKDGSYEIKGLAPGSYSVSALAEPFPMSLAAIGQHVQLLETVGLVRTRKVGRVRTVELAPDAVGAAERWFADHRKRWEERLDRLGDVIAEDDE